MTKTIKKVPQFPAKLLLFGEYSILHGGNALAFPLFQFKGSLDFQKVSKTSEEMHMRLHTKLAKNLAAFTDPKIQEVYRQLMNEMQQGLRFSSNVPSGYGLGSSGMLTAAIFQRYVSEPPTDVSALRNMLAAIESVFHGRSSGLDPLVSYFSQGVLIRAKSIELIQKEIVPEVAGRSAVNSESSGQKVLTVFFDSTFCLIDTGQPRSTEQMVAIFQSAMKSMAYSASFQEEYVRAQNSAIDHVLQNNRADLFENFKAISAWQFHNMKEMIPTGIYPYWKVSLESENFAIKLLGAGGGGFLLGMLRNPKSYHNYSFLSDLFARGQKTAIPKENNNQWPEKFPLTWL